MENIFIVEDDNDINNLLKELLLENNYNVDCAFSGTEALILIENKRYDLCLLDLMLPGKSGEEIIGELSNKSINTIIISAKSDESTLINMLDKGASDYITKPFRNGELLARIRNVLKNKNQNTQNTKDDSVIKIGPVEMNTISHKTKVSNREIDLTNKEFEILRCFLENPNKVFTKRNLYELVWNEEYLDDNTVTVHLSRLRSKLKKYYDGEIIETIWAVGFRLKIKKE